MVVHYNFLERTLTGSLFVASLGRGLRLPLWAGSLEWCMVVVQLSPAQAGRYLGFRSPAAGTSLPRPRVFNRVGYRHPETHTGATRLTPCDQ